MSPSTLLPRRLLAGCAALTLLLSGCNIISGNKTVSVQGRRITSPLAGAVFANDPAAVAQAAPS